MSAIAKKGAAARWGYHATHRGNFKEEFGIDVECYVLNDDTKTAVISKRGMSVALGIGRDSGSALLRFLKGEKVSPFVGHELAQKMENPLIFQAPSLGASQPPTKVHGYDVTILIDICKTIIHAEQEGSLLKRQENFAKQAHIIVNASAKAGIRGLVYALSGYDATKEEVVAAFRFYVREEAREYEREFPDQLYKEWYRLYELPEPERNRPWKFKHLTLEHVYWPLARSNGKILELTQAQRAKSDSRWKKLHQFFSAIGVKALRTHLGQLLGIAQVSKTREEYEGHVDRLFKPQQHLDLREPTTSSNEPQQPS